MTIASALRRHTRIVIASLSVCGVAALVWASFASPVPRVIFNASDSVAIGWYRVDPLEHAADWLPVGSIVLASLPTDAAALAARRGYLPVHIPLLKRVAAVAPQEVCVTGSGVHIDGVSAAALLPTDRLGRRLPSWRQCRRLQPGELFLLSVSSPASFDSRYFGPICTSAVIGVAHPIWLERSQ